jgi:hypothetical protein
MERYEDDVERVLRLSLALVAALALAAIVLFVWHPVWLFGEEASPHLQLETQCESAGGQTVRGVIWDSADRYQNLSLCLPPPGGGQ